MTNLKLKLYLLLMLCICTTGVLTAQHQSWSHEPQASVRMTAQDWLEDLNYLVKRLEIMHPNLYANVSHELFAEKLAELKQMSHNHDDISMISGIMALIALVRDGHTAVDPSINSDPWIPALMHVYPLRVHSFADGLFVLSAQTADSSLVGQKIVKLGQNAIADVQKRISRFICADNEMGILHALPIYLMCQELLEYTGIKEKGVELSITLEDDQGKQTVTKLPPQPLMVVYPQLFLPFFPTQSSELVTLDGQSSRPLPLWLSRPRDNYWFERLDGQRIFVQINAMYHKKDEDFNLFCERLFREIDEKQTSQLIIDLRLNNGGNHIEFPLLKGILARPWLDKPDCLFLLTSRITFSASQHLTTLLARYTNVTILGEPTSGKPNHYGAIRRFKLPHSGLGISSSVVYHQDSQPDDFTLTSNPDLFIPLTHDDYKNRRDPVLLTVIKYDVLKKFRTDFSDQLMKAVQKGGMDGLKKAYFLLKPAFVKLGFTPETLLYKDLDGWMMRNSPSSEIYIEYLKFMLEEMPDSINICFDLASWLETGNRDEAKKLFQHCLDLNPAHKDARMKLALMALEAEQKKK